MSTSTVVMDPLSDEFHRDPHGVTARVREVTELHWIESYGVWVATSHRLVRQLLFDPERVTNSVTTWEGFVPPEPGSVGDWLLTSSLFAQSGAEHARTRRLASRAFTPAAVGRMDHLVAEVVDEAIEMIEGRTGVMDLAEYTLPIPATVISRITGVPPKGGDEERFRQLVGGAVRVVDPFLDPQERERSEEQITELVEYLRWLVAQRREHPQQDMVTDLVQAYDADDRFTNDEVVMMVVALVIAGTETTSHASTLALHSLLTHPDQLALLRSDPSLLAGAVEELLRFELGGTMLPRFAVADCEIAGQQVSKGQIVFLSLAGAHRDPEVFPDPDRLDVTRDTTELIAFGRGPHHCIGAHLARAEMRHVIGRALEVLPDDVALLDDEVRFTPPSFVFRRLENLPVDLGGI